MFTQQLLLIKHIDGTFYCLQATNLTIACKQITAVDFNQWHLWCHGIIYAINQ